MIAGPGYQLMSFVLWLKITVKLRLSKGEKLTVDSPLLVQEKKGVMVPMTAAYMSKRDKEYAPRLGWSKATIHSRRHGFATAAVRCGIHMASIAIAMHRSQGVTRQYIFPSLGEKASITTRLAISSYKDKAEEVYAL